MIRNKTHLFIRDKKMRRQTGDQPRKPNTNIDYPFWVEDAYKFKDTLKTIHVNNENISKLVREYEMNPSVFFLQQLERNISQNCKLINEVDNWLSTWQADDTRLKATSENQNHIKKHIGMMLTEEIKQVFNNKQRIGIVSNQLNHNRSFSRSFSRMETPEEGLQRDKLFNQVNYKIENLNIILRRMGNIVKEQGELINRVDENLTKCQDNMQNAKTQLKERADREEGGSEFSFEGRVNQVITSLYLLNLGLIAVFLIKNSFF